MKFINISQLHNKVHWHFVTSLEYVILLICWSLGCVHLPNHYLSDTGNSVTFENTTPINQNKNKVKIKERRAGWSDKSERYFRTVQCCQCQINITQ